MARRVSDESHLPGLPQGETAVMVQGVHAPPCEDLVEHTHNAYRELGDDHMGLYEFCDYVMQAWQVEEQIKDGGDPALLAHLAAVEADLIFAIDHWIVE